MSDEELVALIDRVEKYFDGSGVQPITEIDTATLKRLTAQLTALRSELERERREKGELVALAAAMLIDVDRYWSFDNYQQHTHSWHCKQDCLEKCRELLEKMTHLAATDYATLMKSMNDIRNGKYRPIEDVIAALTPKHRRTANDQ